MPKYAYIGDEPSVFIFGLTFPKGEPVEVTDAHALKKLPNHPHFRPVSDAPALPEEAPEIGAAIAPIVPDGFARVGPVHVAEVPVNALMPAKRGRRKKETAE